VFISTVDTNAIGANTIETNSAGAAAYSHSCRNHDCSCSNTHFYQHTENEKIIRKLGGVCLTLSTKLKLAEDREKGYLEALDSENKKRKRGQPFTEELRAEQGVSVLFFSPYKVQKARELQDAKEAAKEREALDKVCELRSDFPQRLKRSWKFKRSVRIEL
jgi:hypothetical protein